MGNRVARERSHANEGFADMWVLSVADFLRMDRLFSHEELRDMGLLVQRKPSDFCMFVSHQWLGSKHPDPKMEQLPVLQTALRQLIEGETRAMSDVASQFLGDNQRLSQEQRRKLRDGFLWLDWFSIPQETLELDGSVPVREELTIMPSGTLRTTTSGSTNQDLFISSIPFYVEVSDVFVALVPHCEHSDAAVSSCNLKSYLNRGWCLLEMWCCILSTSEKPFLVVKSSNEVELANLMHVSDRPPHEGQFTFESDRRVIYHVMRTALLAKLRVLKRSKKWDLYRFTLARYEVLLGLPPLMRDLDTFLEDFCFESLRSAQGIRGIGPLECAILSGNAAMIPVLCHAGFDLGRRIHAKINMKTVQDGRTPLHFALDLSSWSPGVVLELLKGRADANSLDLFGIPAMGACRTAEEVKMLIQFRADVNKAAGPWHLPPLPIACARCAPPGVIAALLEHGAEVHYASKGVGGLQPLGALAVFSCWNEHCLQVAQLLLEAAAHVDQQGLAQGYGRLLELSCRARLRLLGGGARRPLLRFMAEWSTTPLGMACYFGGSEYVEFLLSMSADPLVVNNRGHTPFELARGEKVLKIIDQFETFSV